MNKNNKINIVKSLIKNQRAFGAAVILSSSECYNYYEFLQLSALYETCLKLLSLQNDKASLLEISRTKNAYGELQQKSQDLTNNLDLLYKFDALRDFVVWTPMLSSAIFRDYINSFLQVHPTPDEALIVNVLVNSTAVTSINDDTKLNLELIIDVLSVPKLRELDKIFEKSYCFPLRILILKALTQKAHIVYWEYYNLGQLLARFGRHKEALENYKQFFVKALDENQSNVIKLAISEALKSVLYIDDIEESAAYFLHQCPTKIVESAELAKIKTEVESVISSRKIVKTSKTLFLDEVGYHHFDMSALNLMYEKSLQMVNVHPSHALFYSLFKICSVLNKEEEAKHWLKESFDANVLLFTAGS